MLACTPDTFNKFYDLITTLQNEFNIHTRDIYNMDEMGSNLGPQVNTTVLGPADKTATLIKGGGNREWVTVMKCISAAGTYTRPTVIFKGKTLQHQWFDEDTPDFVFTTSQKG